MTLQRKLLVCNILAGAMAIGFAVNNLPGAANVFGNFQIAFLVLQVVELFGVFKSKTNKESEKVNE